MPVKLIVDSGSTKADWCMLNGRQKMVFYTEGMSPYFLNAGQIEDIITTGVKTRLNGIMPQEIYFYGTGCSNPNNVRMFKKVFRKVFNPARLTVSHDLMAAAKALCGDEKGVACILGTGSNSCYYDGRRIVKNSPGLGFVLGDEGSGAYLGKKVIQYFLYNTFDPDLMDRFNAKYQITAPEILEAVYKKPLPNRYLAGFVPFLVENRGHFMIENIIEDGINDFFYQHIYKYRESWRLPVNFIGSVAFGFRDVLKQLCASYELQLGKVLKSPMEGLIKYHA